MLDDDEGTVHQIPLPGSYYIPGVSSHILSPQQRITSQIQEAHGVWLMYDDEIVLWWKQRKYKQSCPIDPNEMNVATIMTAPGYKQYEAFTTEIGDSLEDDDHPLSVTVLNSNIVSEDEQEMELDIDDEQEEAMTYLPDSRDSPLVTNFNLNGPKESQKESPAIIDDGTGQDNMQDAMCGLLSQHPTVLPQQETSVPTRTDQEWGTSQDMTRLCQSQ